MVRRLGLSWMGLIILLILLGLVRSDTAARWHAGSEHMAATNDLILQETDSPIELSLSTSPNVVVPGQSFSLNISVSSHVQYQTFPEIEITLPDSISPNTATLPSGVILDMQNGTIVWHPLVDRQPDTREMTLLLTANVASMHEPLTNIEAQLILNDAVINISTAIWVGVLPNASITFNPPQVAVGQPVQAMALVSGPGPISQEWHLGDGRVVEATDPTFIYPAEGSYQVSLRTSNPLGFSESTAVINVLPRPVASFDPADSTISVGQQLRLINNSGGQPPLAYSWNFGDGYASQEREPVHTYSQPGVYHVSLNIQNAFGQSEVTNEVLVGSPPIADVIVPTVGTAGQVVQLLGFTDDSASEVSWDMGDGRKADGPEAKHVYWSEGDYTVSMTAMNEFGVTTVSNQIHIDSGPLFLFIPLTTFNGSKTPGPGPAPLEIEQVEINEPVGRRAALGEVLDKLEPLTFSEADGPADKLLAYINLARSINNLSPLRYVHELSVAAQRHTDDMAYYGMTGHTGSDNSSPPLRIQQAGYPGGYGGEATAWGMDDPIGPVEFWLNSPGHRAILLHPAVSDVGVGFSLNYESPNIWYWTAEFGSLGLPQIVIQPTPEPEQLPTPDTNAGPPLIDLTVQLLGPPKNSTFTLDPNNLLYFTWSLQAPLSESQFFSLYHVSDGGSRTLLGNSNGPVSGNQYQLVVDAADIPANPGINFWQVELADTSGQILASSDLWPIQLTLAAAEDTTEPTVESPPQTQTPAPIDPPASDPLPTPLPLSTPLPTPTP